MNRTLVIMNGWRDAPHLWRQYLLKPILLQSDEQCSKLWLFGFVFFYIKKWTPGERDHHAP